MSPQLSEVSLDLGTVRALYADGLSPGDLIREVYRRVQAKPDVGVWTALVPLDAALARAKALARLGRANLPLYGVPLSVKDNIDVRGLPTTAGCPAFAHLPEKSATVVRRMEDAGAILVGKNTMDQFATGLVGIRSPVHPVNSFDAARIPTARVPARRLPSRSASSASIRHLFMVDTHSPRNDRGWHKRRQPCPTPSRRCRASSLRRP